MTAGGWWRKIQRHEKGQVRIEKDDSTADRCCGVRGAFAAEDVRGHPVSSLGGLQAMAGDLKGRYYLTRDIDAAPTQGWDGGKGFVPIGTDGNRFDGAFDGRGFAVRGLWINRTNDTYVGLFGAISKDAVIANVHLSSLTVAGGERVGGLAGDSNGRVSNCSVTGSVSGVGARVGGLAGDNDGSIRACSMRGTVRGANTVGGLVGQNGGSILGCTNGAAVRGAADDVGGVAGDNNYWIILCGNSGAITGGEDVGGIVGRNDGGVRKCWNSGAVEGTGTDFGGLAGVNAGLLDRSFNAGPVVANDTAGGAVGQNGGTVRQCFSTGRVEGLDNALDSVGGLIGDNRVSALECYSAGAVIGDQVGGLAGSNGMSLAACYWDDVTSAASLGVRFGSGTGVVGTNTAALFRRGTFAGWDFVKAWAIVEGSGYPTLRWEPVANDFDGDERSDVAVYSPPGGRWHILESVAGYREASFGYAGTVPVTGDFDGDRMVDYGCYDAARGAWYLMRSRTGFVALSFGYTGRCRWWATSTATGWMTMGATMRGGGRGT
jgi:mucin-19